MPQNRLFLIAVFIIIGSSNPIAVKFALNAGWTPFALGMLRMAVIGIFFILLLMARGEGLIGPNGPARRYIVIAAVCKAVGVVLFYIALWIIPANRAVVISTISPVVSLVLIYFILEHEHMRRHHILGILTSLAGMLFLVIIRGEGGDKAETSDIPLIVGDIVMIASVVFNNAMVVFEKKALIYGAGPGQLLVSTNLLSVAVFAALFAITGETLHDIPGNKAAVGAYLYLISVVGIFLFYYRRWLVSRMEVTYMSSFSHLGKTVSIFYAGVLLGERISHVSLICFAVILAGTIVATREQSESKSGARQARIPHLTEEKTRT